VFVSANVAIGGYVRVGNNCFIGVHSTIKDGVTVGDYTLVGAAANIVRDTEDQGVYVRNPAKKLLHKFSETKI
jgi:acetyltransferase-like isoleucine patch superfamily enzyme